MTIAVDLGRKATTQTNNSVLVVRNSIDPTERRVLLWSTLLKFLDVRCKYIVARTVVQQVRAMKSS